MISIDQAFRLVLEQVTPVPPLNVPLAAALGRTLASDAVSDVDSPPYDKALMDGYALRAEDFDPHAPSLPISDNIPAGNLPRGPLIAGTAVRIMTGAPLPQGADTVVAIEETALDGDPPQVRVLRTRVETEQHILRQGTCLGRGQVILPRGTRLRGVELGLLAETGNDPVAVNRDIRVAIIATGNELVAASLSPGPGRIRNSNGPLLCGLVAEAGATPLDLGIARDELPTLRERIDQGLQADILLLSGGVSAGDLDLVPQVLRDCGVREIFTRSISSRESHSGSDEPQRLEYSVCPAIQSAATSAFRSSCGPPLLVWRDKPSPIIISRFNRHCWPAAISHAATAPFTSPPISSGTKYGGSYRSCRGRARPTCTRWRRPRDWSSCPRVSRSQRWVRYGSWTCGERGEQVLGEKCDTRLRSRSATTARISVWLFPVGCFTVTP